eukprot:Skav223590  [mRNA]  locus=scaffold493:14082:17134:- [translate_table: standard]
MASLRPGAGGWEGARPGAIGVKHASEERLEEALQEVSSPTSRRYGHYWSLNMGDFVRVKKSVLELEDLLKLRFRPFRHQARMRSELRAGSVAGNGEWPDPFRCAWVAQAARALEGWQRWDENGGEWRRTE